MTLSPCGRLLLPSLATITKAFPFLIPDLPYIRYILRKRIRCRTSFFLLPSYIIQLLYANANQRQGNSESCAFSFLTVDREFAAVKLHSPFHNC